MERISTQPDVPAVGWVVLGRRRVTAGRCAIQMRGIGITSNSFSEATFDYSTSVAERVGSNRMKTAGTSSLVTTRIAAMLGGLLFVMVLTVASAARLDSGPPLSCCGRLPSQGSTYQH